MLGDEVWAGSNSSHKSTVGLRSGLRADHFSSLTPILGNKVFTDLSLVTGAFVI